MLHIRQGPDRLKELMMQTPLLVTPGVYDGLSARVAEAAGFEALYVGGGAIARSMGYPDVGLITLTEIVKRLQEIRAVTRVPLIVDADTGYGNELNVMRTIQALEQAGISALHIEDQVDPKRCGHHDGKSVIPAGEMILKIRAALAARTNPNLQIIARTDSRAVLGLAEAIRRGNAYAEAGADMIFVDALESVAEIEQAAREIKAPQLSNMFWGGKTPLVSQEQLAEWGYRLMIVPSDLQRAAIKGMQEAAAALKSTGHTADMKERMISFRERDEVVGTDAVRTLQERLLKGQ